MPKEAVQVQLLVLVHNLTLVMKMVYISLREHVQILTPYLCIKEKRNVNCAISGMKNNGRAN